MYRFLLTPRWLGLLVLALAAAVVMVLLGNWQLDRYHGRTAINERIDAGLRMDPVPLREALPAPTGGPGAVGAPPAEERTFTRVTVTGRYDTDNIVLVRGRTAEGRVGFEVVTPLLLADGTPSWWIEAGSRPPPAGGGTAGRATDAGG